MPVLDERVFESAVELSPEEQASNDQYLQDKGYQTEDLSEREEPGTAVETPPAIPEPVVDPSPAEPADAIDAESNADWQTAKNDGEKLGKYAKQTLRRKVVEAELLKEKAVNDELRRQLEAKNGSSAPTPAPAVAPSSQLTPPAAVAQPVEDKKPEPPKAKVFDKPRPELPNYDDYLTDDDTLAAYNKALGEWNRSDHDWLEEKRDFDQNQKLEVEKQTRQQEQDRNQENEKNQRYATKFREVQTAHPDFETTTKGVIYNPVLLYLLGDPDEGLKDGMELYYQLAQPEHREFLNELVKNTQTVPGEEPKSIHGKLTEATSELAVFRHSLKTKKAPVAEAPKAPEVTEPPSTTPPAAVTPRREAPAPSPVRSRGAAASRLEDIPVHDYDARRKWREENGQV